MNVKDHLKGIQSGTAWLLTSLWNSLFLLHICVSLHYSESKVTYTK